MARETHILYCYAH